MKCRVICARHVSAQPICKLRLRPLKGNRASRTPHCDAGRSACGELRGASSWCGCWHRCQWRNRWCWRRAPRCARAGTSGQRPGPEGRWSSWPSWRAWSQPWRWREPGGRCAHRRWRPSKKGRRRSGWGRSTNAGIWLALSHLVGFPRGKYIRSSCWQESARF